MKNKLILAFMMLMFIHAIPSFADTKQNYQQQRNDILQQIEALPPEQRARLVHALIKRYPPPPIENMTREQRRALHEALRAGKLSPEQQELLKQLRHERLRQFENMDPEERRLWREPPPPPPESERNNE